MSFTIQFQELDFLKKNLKIDTALSSVIPDVSIAILKFHNTLETRVSSLYTLKDTLDSVRISRTVSPSELGNTFLEYSLQYKAKEVPLSEYNYNEDSVPSATARYPKRRSNGNISWIFKGYALQVKTEIRKGKSKLARRGKGNYRYKGFLQHNVIYARMQKATWSEYPTKFSEGTRAPYVRLFGPTLARLAESTYDKDSIMQQAKDKVGEDMLKAFVKWYPK